MLNRKSIKNYCEKEKIVLLLGVASKNFLKR